MKSINSSTAETMDSVEMEKEEIKRSAAIDAVDSFETIEIDQSTENSSKEEQNSKEHELHFPGKSKKFLTFLRKKIEGFKRIVKDQHFQWFRGDQIERTKVYHVWSGNNVFFFRGRLICGPDPKGLLLTVVSISLSSWTFAVHVASDMGNHSNIIISSILTMIVFINLGLVSTIDPGIIPRNDDFSVELGEKSERKKMIVINGTEVKLRYCKICNIFRPPRSCHCAVCDNCVEKFDHHCPWIGHCIGLRNYRFYLTFLVTALVFFLFILVFSCKRIQYKLFGDGIGIFGVFRDCPETLVLAAFSFSAVCFLGGLSYYHVYLITINQTAYENFHQKYESSINPFNRGILHNIKVVLLSSQPPSRVNFRADLHSLGDVGI